MRVYIRRHRYSGELRNGHVQYARRPVHLHSEFSQTLRGVERSTEPAAWALAVGFGIGALATLAGLIIALFFLAEVIARLLRHFGVGGS